MTLFTWTRRGLMAAAAGAVLALGALPEPATAQTPPGVLIVGQIAEPKSLDPAAVTAVNDFRILVNVYEGLTRYGDGTLQPEPALATDWEISEDGTVYTFTLREGVTFHDGTPFNAEAVKFNFDRMLNEDHPYHDTGPFPLSFFFGAVEKTEVVDDMTVRFTLNAPYAPFLSNLAYPTGLIVSPEAVKEHGEDFGRNPVGHRPVQVRRVEIERARRRRAVRGLLGRARRHRRGGVPPHHRRQHPRGRDAGRGHRPDGRGAAHLDRTVRGRCLYGARTGRPACLVPDPQRQGRPLRRQARAAGGELCHRQGSDRQRRARRHGHRRRRPHPAGLRLGL